ncbi:TonB-dependent siderophore receptor [Massilia sp. Mn16-1_5]|uniref:TonB-dependent receptor plug domain-containing protein n=1 Tax=Massilia sp. Mn16-1_5 TaxID=2079199 RepID=UPI00109E7015|nr:TonB-dependent receptor [Massilia sp. Mn16-1_5]THC39196.1 TonB-dependent receptor [Massilia sp. Mn16-1_5]
MNKLISAACLALLGAAAMPALAAGQNADPAAQPAPETKPGTSTKAAPSSAPVAQVNVTGSRANDTDQRRLSTAAKMVFGREELDRNGDTSVGDILKRLPGVTMGGPPGRGGGGAVRMRGLGNGYTQVLINGERPPPGFSIESLPPEQVERIEVMRGPVAEHSTQAIAGTINIVLREGYRQKEIQLRAGDNVSAGQHSPNLSLSLPGQSGNLSWLMNVNAMAGRTRSDSDSYVREEDLAGNVTREQNIHTGVESRTRGMFLSPRLSYKFDNGDTLTFQPFVGINRNDNGSDTFIDHLGGTRPAEYARLRTGSESESQFVRAMGNWLHKMDGGAKLDMKLSGGASRNDSDSLRYTSDAAGATLRTFNDVDNSRNSNLTHSGKYTAPMGKGHLLALGWDLEGARLKQVHVAESDGGALFEDSGANLQASTRRLALFAQDEWDITERWSMYLGLRWEGIRTSSTGSASEVSNTSRVWSPVVHTVWRIPGFEKDQLRASLTQSYRAAPLNDMIASPSFATYNARVSPDRSGNPDLKPELARGIDLAYEHYLGKSGILSASGFIRKVDNLIRRVITERQTSQGLRYLSSPRNIGSARTSGIELEAKFQLAELVANSPDIDFRSNYSRFWSSVEGIPGPNNRLDGQAEQTANVGLDYRMKGRPLTLGGSYNWTPAVLVQTSALEASQAGVKRQVDLYGLWKFSATTQLRLSVNNLLAEDYVTARYYAAPNGFVTTRAHTDPTYGLRFEMKL